MKKKAPIKKKAASKRKTAAKSRRKVATKKVTKRTPRKRRRMYTYDTLVGEVEQDMGIETSVPSDMKLGDYFKKKKRYALVELLGGGSMAK